MCLYTLPNHPLEVSLVWKAMVENTARWFIMRSASSIFNHLNILLSNHSKLGPNNDVPRNSLHSQLGTISFHSGHSTVRRSLSQDPKTWLAVCSNHYVSDIQLHLTSHSWSVSSVSPYYHILEQSRTHALNGWWDGPKFMCSAIAGQWCAGDAMPWAWGRPQNEARTDGLVNCHNLLHRFRRLFASILELTISIIPSYVGLLS